MLDSRSDRLRSALLIVSVSALVHIWLVLASKVFSEAIPFGDLSLYNYWVFEVEQGAPLYGVFADWVYPALAFLPMWLAKQFAFFGFELSWVFLIFILNSLAATLLQSAKSKSFTPYAYLAGIALLGPVAISRIDAVSVAVAAFGLIAIQRNLTGLAASLFTLAGWIKVWPIALFIALITSFKSRTKIFLVAASISISILIGSIALAGDLTVLSFVFSQQNRGIQIESVIATPFLWMAKLGFGKIYFDQLWLTNQIAAPGAEFIAGVSNLVMFLALGITALLALLALQRGVERRVIFALASLTAVLDLIVFNKVGSPQFMIWLLIPAIALMIFKVPKIKLLLVGVGLVLGLTQLIYPVSYISLLGLEWAPIITITFRNLALVGLLVIANSRLLSEKPL